MENFEACEHVFELQKKYKNKAKVTDVHYRLKKLKAFRDLMIKNKAEIASSLAQDFRKPGLESDLTEVLPIISMINLLEKRLGKWMKDKKVKTPLLFKGTKSWVRREGKGNCLIISPWNYPFQLTVYPILTAFAAGNTCIVKPSEFTPSTNKIVRKLIEQIFTKEEVSIFEGEASLSTELLKLPFDHIFFTGSTNVGKVVMEAVSKNPSSVSLELGGKSPCVIGPNVDIYKACKRIAWGKMVNSGQTCVAPDYLLTLDENRDQVIESLSKSINKFYSQKKYATNEDYSQIITERHGLRLEGLVKDAVNKGAKVHLGGSYHPASRVMEPTILSNVTSDMKLMQEEIFGPILPILSFETTDQMIEEINSRDNALGIYVFSDDKKFVDEVLNNTATGGATINDTLLNVGHPSLPFGGSGKSGIGMYHGKHGFDEFSNLKAVLSRHSDYGAGYFYPPYDEKKKSSMDSLIKKFSRFF
ncbi:MAG: aldehyde dehydrogenase family protein [Bacteriovoracaceae bacterium]|nr:aldehyde dehydrogenase family protein [Bacteriovoracaceae bacterium]